MRWLEFHALVLTLLVVEPVTGQPVAQTQPEAAREQRFEDLHWAIRLGLRSHQVAQAFPTVDRVVLVPDAMTYLDEMSHWSPQGGRWPVLIEDEHFAPMFVRRFKPDQLLRRESVGDMPPERELRQDMLRAVVVRSLGGDPAASSIRDIFKQHNYIPPGVVIASVDDPAWTAAVALAAGHGQPLAFLDEPWGEPNGEIDSNGAQRVMSAVEAAVADQGYPWEMLGDAIDAVTICRAMAVRADARGPLVPRATVGGPHGEGPVALTDLLGRKADGSRFAFAGWIFGSEVQSAYIAMCSLFLPRDDVLLVNAYSQTGEWSAYDVIGAETMFRQRGFRAQAMVAEGASVASWRRMLAGGTDADLVLMNSMGNADFFDLTDGRMYANDVPVLNEPAAVHLIHSWSMQAPASAATVGGRWLAHGAYALVGSCWEPYLGAFLPPAAVAERLTNFVPLLVAARYWEGQGPMAHPWRVVTFGDPLLVMGPPAASARPRVESNGEARGVDLRELVKAAMRQASDDPRGENFGQAMSMLECLGEDRVASQLWQIAAAHKGSGQAARAALGALFRLRSAEEFMEAWMRLPARDPLAEDMLWHLLGPRLGGVIEPDWLIQLQSAVRQPAPQVDLARLAPALERSFGRIHAQEVIQREMARTRDDAARRTLNELLRQYQ